MMVITSDLFKFSSFFLKQSRWLSVESIEYVTYVILNYVWVVYCDMPIIFNQLQ